MPCPAVRPARFYQNFCLAETDGLVGWQVSHGNTALDITAMSIQVVNNTFVDFPQGVIRRIPISPAPGRRVPDLVFWNNIVVDCDN